MDKLGHMRSLVTVAKLGSFSAAARALALSQPTVGRQIASLEEELGVLLFERIGHGLELTLVGEEHGLGLRLKSIDGGLSWEPMPVDVSAPPLTACHADATGVVYVGAEGYLGVETSGWGVEEPPPEEL